MAPQQRNNGKHTKLALLAECLNPPLFPGVFQQTFVAEQLVHGAAEWLAKDSNLAILQLQGAWHTTTPPHLNLCNNSEDRVQQRFDKLCIRILGAYLLGYVRGQAHSKTQGFENSQRVWAKTIAQNLIVLLYCKVDGIVFHLKLLLLLASVCKRNMLFGVIT